MTTHMASPPLLVPENTDHADIYDEWADQASFRRSVPKIGGSVGGFIAVVVLLIVIIIVACTSIVYLLRTHAKEDRIRRRNRGRYRHHPTSSTTAFMYSPSTAAHEHATRQPSWWDKLENFLSSRFGDNHPSGNSTRLGKKSRRGFVRTDSGDEWDTESDQEHEDEERPRSAQRSRSPRGSKEDIALNERFQPPSDPTKEPTSPVTAEYDTHALPELSYGLRAPSPKPTVPNRNRQVLHSPLANPPVPLPNRTVSTPPESQANTPDDETTALASSSEQTEQSLTSPRTFESGTKFFEAL